MRLIFLRHAKSIFNELNLIQGQYDCELSNDGIQQTKDLKKMFNKTYDYCYCSPLKRTKMTAEIINDDIPIVYDDRLKEVSFGEWEKTQITQEKIQNYISGRYIPEGAETHKEVEKRVFSFLNDLKTKHKEKDIILIITHGGVINVVQKILGLEDKKINNLGILETNL